MNLEDIPTILCVDDEPRVVDGLALHLRKNYRILTAISGQAALQILKDQGAQKLLGRIPRLEQVLEILGASQRAKKDSVEDSSEGLIKLGATILRMVLDYDTQIARGQPAKIALQSLRVDPQRHEAPLLKCLEPLVGTAADGQEVSEMPVDRVMSGIVFLDELRTSIGTLLVPKVFEVTDAFLERMRNFGPGILQEKVRVLSPVKRAALRTTA
jgi:CheY-like chemotaxis protein